MSKIARDAEHLFDSAVMSPKELQKHAEPFTEADFVRFFNSLSDTESKLREAAQPRYVLEIGLVKLIEMRRVSPVETILERLAKLENALSGGNFQSDISSEETVKTEPSAEKKKLAVDFPLEEIPFPIKTASSQPISDFELGISDLEKVEVRSPKSEDQNNNGQQEAGEESQSKIDLVEIIANMPSKLPPISSEELEHIEDNALDAAYEAKLLRSGDDLYPIKNASKIIELLLGGDSKPEIPAKTESSGGAATGAAPAREKSIFMPPVFETEADSEEIPELPENPTEEELWNYAANHPLTKKVIRAFRGKIVEVKKL
jgi:DNA polymerase III gamma/tau subunit